MAEQFAHDRRRSDAIDARSQDNLPLDGDSSGRPGSTFRNTAESLRVDEEVRMGDRGGKKAKEKNQQQQINKQKEKQQRKDDKAAPRAPLPASH